MSPGGLPPGVSGKRDTDMWIAKIQVVIEHGDGSQALRTEEFLEGMELKRVYRAAMRMVRTYVAEDEAGCKIAAIYKDMDIWEANEDDATKANTEALYTIARGELGGIDVFDHRQKRNTEVRENRESGQEEKTFIAYWKGYRDELLFGYLKAKSYLEAWRIAQENLKKGIKVTEVHEASEANITPSSITMNFENKSEYHFGW